MTYPVDVAPIREDETFDRERVAAYLHANLPDVGDRPITFLQFPGGKANLTYLARVGDDLELVLRRPPLGPVAPGSHDMAREYSVLARLWEVFPKAPRAYLLCTDEEVMGKPFFVMERRRGIVIREAWPPGFGDETRRRTAVDLVDTLAALHLVDYESLGLADLGRPEGFVARQVAGWTKRWHLAKEHDLAAMDELGSYLEANVPEPQRAVLLHNDFKLDNTMVRVDGTLEAVFDWDMATLGDPLVDLGTALAYWADPDDATFLIFGDSVVSLSPYLSRDDVAARYAGRTGFDVSTLDFYLALAMYRLTVIIQQIYIRYVRGQTRDERFAGLGAVVPALAEAGLAGVT